MPHSSFLPVPVVPNDQDVLGRRRPEPPELAEEPVRRHPPHPGRRLRQREAPRPLRQEV